MKQFKLFTIALAALTMAACSNEDDLAGNGSNGATKGAPIDLQIDVEGLSATTKSNAEGLVGDVTNPSGAVNPWVAGDKIRLFITDYDQAVAGTFVKYEGAVELNREISYTLNPVDGKNWPGWIYSDGVDDATLSNVKARLYAYSPSLTENSNCDMAPNLCPITFNTPNKIDYMYGTHRNTLDGTTTVPGDNSVDQGGSTHSTGTNLDYIDGQNTKVRLYMKHAQSIVEVRLLKNDTDPKKKYSGEGKVTAVEIMGLERYTTATGKIEWQPLPANNPPKTGICNATAEGAITVQTREVLPMTDFYTAAGGTCDFTLNPTVASGTANPTTGFALVCPTADDVVRGFHIQVDGKDYYICAGNVKYSDQHNVTSTADEEKIEWKAGYRYIYNLTLTGKGIELVPDPTNPDGNKDGDVDGDGISDFVVVKPWTTDQTIDQDF